MIIQNVKTYTFSENTKPISNYNYSSKGVIIRLRLADIPKDNRLIAEVPGTLRITQGYATKKEIECDLWDNREHLFQKTDENGFVSIVTIELFFFSDEHPDWKSQKLSIPLNLYDICKKDLWVICNKTHFRLVYDGAVVNENMIYGVLNKPNGAEIFIDYKYISYIEFSSNPDSAKFSIRKKLCPDCQFVIHRLDLIRLLGM